MPPRVDVRGVEFIEFAASDEEAHALGGMLSALGFARTATHRRKAVTRWQQGDINIVMNCEPEGFAHSYDVVHGASVCALGLRVDDVAAALDRAEHLEIPRFTQAVGPEEMQIPSVKGVGGSLIYFIEDGAQAKVWEHEFTHPVSSDARPRPLALQRVDHIAQTMQYEEFLSGLLYYVALFDVAKTPQIEIADTLGLIQSQAIESPDRVAARDVERLHGRPNVVGALHPALHGRRRAALGILDGRHFCRGGGRPRERFSDARYPAQLLRRHRSEVRRAA